MTALLVVLLVFTEPAPSAAAAPPLSWVSPKRCLRPCDAEPVAPLTTVDDLGRRAAKGPHRVMEEVQAPLAALIRAGARANQRMRVSSAYRSYTRQAELFAETRQLGRAARPGHSEHQIGTAVDLRLATTAVATWLAQNAHRFGFVVSYPPGKQKLTGYPPEMWHVRFVGRPLATLMHRQRLSLEEGFRAALAPTSSGNCGDCPSPASQAPACGTVTPDGACTGDVLSFCFDGVLAQIDCAHFQQSCQRVGETHDCAPSPSPREAKLPTDAEIPSPR